MNNLQQALTQIEPGYIPEEIFREVARLVVLSTVVVVPLHAEDGTLQVLLTKRAERDHDYAGMLHPPGTILRPYDNSIDAAIERLINTEMAGVEFSEKPLFVDYVYEEIERGREVSLLFLGRIKTIPGTYTLYDVEALPDTLIQTDFHRIRRVVEAYWAIL
jgi:hypothetical protein